MKLRYLATTLLLLTSFNLFAAEVAGVKFDETATTDKGTQLVLNGAGLRYKLFIKVYAGALYLENKTTSADQILGSDKPNRMLMHFIYDGVSKEKIVKGWNNGFEKNLDADALKALQPRINDFNALFSDTKSDDEIMFDYTPGSGTRVTIKGKEVGNVKGKDFNKALLSIWLGKHPVTGSLKDALLGKD